MHGQKIVDLSDMNWREMKVIKGHTKVSKLNILLNADPLALYKLSNLTNFHFSEGNLTSPVSVRGHQQKTFDSLRPLQKG